MTAPDPLSTQGSSSRSSDEAWKALDDVVSRRLKTESADSGSYAGGVLLVVQGESLLKLSAYGHAELFDERGVRLECPRAMEVDSIFDLASISKAVSTANLLALLHEEGAICLTDPVCEYLPVFDRPGKREIRVEHLLTHSSGLANWLPFYLLVDDGEEALELIADLPESYPLGGGRSYSDVNFVVLGKLVEAVAGKPLDRLFEDLVAGPLGLTRTRYRPPESWRPRTVATSLGNPMEQRMCAERTFPVEPGRNVDDLERWRRQVLVGEVNDANCHLVFGGVAGHAGLFGTAGDLARLAGTMLDSLRGRGDALLRRDTVNWFSTPKLTPGQGLGWWTNRLDVAPRTFGHRGFTGTQLFVDPDNDLLVVLLTNRVHSALPYAEPDLFTAPIMSGVYRAVKIADDVRVDPWLQSRVPRASSRLGVIR
jgi:CubicO group peptidase (beta-lactamase class C family)